jgi:aspartate beta-hydroxylase
LDVALQEQIQALVQVAGAAARSGDMVQAERAWRQVIDLDAGHADAHFALGFHAFQRGNGPGASQHFRTAACAPGVSPGFQMTVAAALDRIGDLHGQLEVLDAILGTNPYFLPAMLKKATALAGLGQMPQAASCYRNALAMAGPDFNWPGDLRPALLEAQEFVAREAQDKLAWLARQVADRATAPDTSVRMAEAMSILAGASKPYPHQPIMFHVPRLPATTFFDPALFPEVAQLEASTDAIRLELEHARRVAPHLFQPYVRYKPGEPVNQWEKLNHSDDWAGMFVWKDGHLQEEAARLCPQTVAAFSALPMPVIEGFCPTVMFSALAPGARIPPHTGETNVRLVGHLPLIVPDGCRYRVGWDWRQWEVGKCLIFDDSIEHEAINDSTETRVVVLFDLWNPNLTQAERDLASALLVANRTYYA